MVMGISPIPPPLAGPPPLPSTTLALFAYREVTPQAMIAIVREIKAWPELNFKWAGNHALIERTRNVLVTGWYKHSSDDVLVMVDHDIAWEKGDVQQITQQAHRMNCVIGGAYSKRGFGIGTSFKTQYSVRPDTIGLLPATAVGGGFMAIPRLILRELTRPQDEWDNYSSRRVRTYSDGTIGFFETMVENGFPLPEDWSFCRRVLDLSDPGRHRLYVSTNPTLTHIGEYEYTLSTSGAGYNPINNGNDGDTDKT